MDELIMGAAKPSIKAAGGTQLDMWQVPVEQIKVIPGFNAWREADPDYPAHVEMLAQSIVENGFLRHNPIKVVVAADGQIFVTNGHSRLAAVAIARTRGKIIEKIPCIPEVNGTTDIDRLFAKRLDNASRPPTPLGFGLIIKDMLGAGVDEKEICRRLSINPQQMGDYLNLAGAPRAVQEMVKDGKLSGTEAIATLRTDGAAAPAVLKKAAKLAKEAGKDKVTKRFVDAARASDKPAVPAIPPPPPKPAEAAVQEAVGLASQRMAAGTTPNSWPFSGRAQLRAALDGLSAKEVHGKLSKQNGAAISTRAVEIVMEAIRASLPD